MLGGITLRRFGRNLDAAAEELALCRRIAAGETHLFARIVDEHGSLVSGVIAAQGVPTADIEDVAQRAFVNAYRGLAGFRGDARLSSWLYRITLNLARAHLKQLAQRPTPDSVEAAAEAGRVTADGRSGPDVACRGALRAALLRLAEPQRIALSLYYFEELSYEEISGAMRLNINTVRTHIRRGKQRLAELLDPALLESM